ncbi:MAG: class I SAM-dependent methyltransferase [Nitrospirota bacterium]
MDPLSKTLQGLYAARFAGTADYRNSVWRVLCTDFFSAFITERSTVLDLGAGWGEFINNIPADHKIAMDLNPDTGALLAPGIRLIQQDCSVRWPVNDNALDVVFTSNFLEHLTDKASIQRTIAEAYRCLKDNGAIICLGPNIKYLPGEYWDFWDHQVPLTDKSCCELLQIEGFHIERSIPRFLPYSMSSSGRPPLFLVKWYCNLPVLWPLFGKQFLIVAKKGPAAERSIRS